MTPIVLASSPLVGAGALHDLAEHVRAGGRDVAVPDVPFDLDAFEVSVGAACRAGDGPPVLVGYSAAGPRLFQVATVAEPAALVFLDARLPTDGVAPDADPTFRRILDALPTADDGTLPPWTDWWPDVIEELVPDASMRARLAAGCRRAPRAMFSCPIPAPPSDVPCGYVGLGVGYAAAAADAAGPGWSVDVIDGADHLWPVTRPAAVAEAIAGMADRLVP